MKRLDVRLILTATCEEASRLASAAQERRLTLSERIALRLHSLICRSCRAFARQLQTLRQAMDRMPPDVRAHLQQDPIRLSPARCEVLKRLMEDATPGDSQ